MATGKRRRATVQISACILVAMQLTVASALSSRPETVAVIGGGIAGLTCGRYLAQSGRFDVTVFDTGRLRPGGRCSSRLPNDPVKETAAGDCVHLRSTIVDHAAQILSVPRGFPEFQTQVAAWEKQGIVTKYPEGSVCNIVDKKGEGFALRPLNGPSKPALYYGTQGMGSIPMAIQQSSQATLQQDVWVAPSNGVRYQKASGKWKLQAKGNTLGIFDRLVIAHNGKCADRIMSLTPAKSVHQLLRVNFAPRIPPGGATKMTLNSIYSLTFALPVNSTLDRALPPKFVCGFVQNEPTLRFLSCPTRKYASPTTTTASEEEKVQVWTVLSSPAFAKKHKAPQESLPADVVQTVTSLLLQGLERSLSLPSSSSSLAESLLESRLQLWGAAVPINVWVNQPEDDQSSAAPVVLGYLHDDQHQVGVCGDWLLEPSIAGAWESGRRLAEYISKNPAAVGHDSTKPGVVVGAKGSFRASPNAMKAGIGSLL